MKDQFQFIQRFGREPQVSSTAPGRINLIGEHTDYNDGFVLPGAIDKKVSFLLAKNETEDLCRVYSADMKDSVEFSLHDLYAVEGGGWKNYIVGVAAELENAGASLQGFDAAFGGDIPLGAGLSSSAALECALATGLNTLFDLGFSGPTLAEISQIAEYRYAGVACGIMDQFASMMGKKDQVFRLDCGTLEYQYFPLDLGPYQLLLLDTCVEHSLAGTAYNERRNQCEEGVKALLGPFPHITSLGDITLDQLQKHKSLLPAIVYQRCLHVVQENKRVQQSCKAISDHDISLLGNLLYQSHDSLSDLYEVSCPELDFLVDFTRPLGSVLGARMMGGGFGGCTLNLLLSSEKDTFIESASEAYFKETGIHLKSYPVSLEEGASAIQY